MEKKPGNRLEQYARSKNVSVEEVVKQIGEEKRIYEFYPDLDTFIVKKHRNLGYYPHFHQAVELYYILESDMVAVINGKKKTIRKDEMFIVNGFEIHTYEKNENSQVLVFLISSKYLTNYLMEYPGKSLDNFLCDRECNRSLLPFLEEIYENLNRYTELEKIGCACLILGRLIREYGVSEHKNTNGGIVKIIEYIYENYRQNVTIASLAKEFNYAPNSISRIFRKSIGIDFRIYINNVRAEKAHAMLLDETNGENLTQIARRNGFNSMSSFYRAYRRIYNCLPVKRKSQ